MKISVAIKLQLVPAMLFAFVYCSAQSPQNWTNKQLMEPADLAKEITRGKDLPLVISVGPGAPIPNSINVGMVNTKEGFARLQGELNKLPKQPKVVVYCGCCPFEHCPNVRPAIEALKEQKFTNYYLLNLPNNIKKDWIEKGYPVVK